MYKCYNCNYRTNLAIKYIHHCLNTHAEKELTNLLRNKQSIDNPVIFLLAEQIMALREGTQTFRKYFEYIKEVLKPKFKSAIFNCERCMLLYGCLT